jgi:hypothetical protein
MRQAQRPKTSTSHPPLDPAGASPQADSPTARQRAAAESGRQTLVPARFRLADLRAPLPRVAHGRALIALVASLVVLVAAALATTLDQPADISPVSVVQPAPGPSAPTDPCVIAPPQVCASPPTTTTVPPRPGPSDETPATSPSPSSSAPCSGEGCIPQPGTTTAPPTDPDGDPAAGGEAEDECGITDVGACITEALNAFFRGIVTAALNPLLDLLSRTLLTTPLPEDLPQVGELWNSSWQILLVSYGLLILIAGVIVMSYHTLQTQHSIRQIAPRIVVGFLAGGLSLWLATKAIQIANALARAVMSGGVDTSEPMVVPGHALKDLILGALTGGIWIIFLGIALAGILVALLVTYIIRVALTFAVIAGAPLALMFHALPQTEGIGYWWWRVLGGCLAIQIGQSLTLITMMRVFFAPGGFTMFGPNVDGLVNLLVAIALMYVLFRIPGWILGAAHVGGGRRSMLGTLARGFVFYHAFRRFGGGHGRGGGGARGGGGGGGHGPVGPAGGGPGRPGRGGLGGHPGPGGHPRAGGHGQRRRNPRGHAAAAHRQQTPLFPGARQAGTPTATPRSVLESGGPEDTSGGLDGLPLNVQRATSPPPRSDASGQPTRARRGKELESLLDPYRGNRPNRSGQYPLPLNDVRRVPRASPPPPADPGPSGYRTVQAKRPVDPYKGNRATRGGQYPLPIDSARRAPASTPAPPPTAPPHPAPQPRQQLRLPVDLPTPPKPPTTTLRSSPPSAARRRPDPGGKTS